jgi:hypothetical protein
MDHRKVIDQSVIEDENLVITTLMDYNEEKIFLKVDYLDGKFIIEKQFRNNYIGIDEFEKTKNNLMSEESVKAYFGM